MKDSGREVTVFEVAIGEKKVFFVDYGDMAVSGTESTHDAAKLARGALVRVLEAVKDKITCTYAKYFVNNSLIVEEDAFTDHSVVPKLSAELYSYIDQEIKNMSKSRARFRSIWTTSNSDRSVDQPS